MGTEKTKTLLDRACHEQLSRRVRESGAKHESGLVVSTRPMAPTGQRHVIALVHTPKRYDDAVADDNPQLKYAPKDELDERYLDASWLAVHAADVEALLPGGLCVSGVYVVSDRTALEQATSLARRCAYAVCKQGNEGRGLGGLDDEPLLMAFDRCDACAPVALRGASGVHLTDAALCTLTTVVPVSVPLSIVAMTADGSTLEQLYTAIHMLADTLGLHGLVVDGDSGLPCSRADGLKRSPGVQSRQSVKLVLPVEHASEAAAAALSLGGGDVAVGSENRCTLSVLEGALYLSGRVLAVAQLSTAASGGLTCGDVVCALAQDVRRGLMQRVRMLVRQLDDVSERHAIEHVFRTQKLTSGVHHVLPRRVCLATTTTTAVTTMGAKNDDGCGYGGIFLSIYADFLTTDAEAAAGAAALLSLDDAGIDCSVRQPQSEWAEQVEVLSTRLDDYITPQTQNADGKTKVWPKLLGRKKGGGDDSGGGSGASFETSAASGMRFVAMWLLAIAVLIVTVWLLLRAHSDDRGPWRQPQTMQMGAKKM